MPADIYEQMLKIPPAQLADLALAGLERQGRMVAQVLARVQDQLDSIIDAARIERIYLVGCGDSFFAALSARHAFEQLTGLPTVALESMELAHYTLLMPNALVLVISSTGEVVKTLEAGRAAQQAGCEVIGVTAQKSSRLTTEFPCLVAIPDLADGDYADQAALMLCNFSFSLAALYRVAVHIGRRRNHIAKKVEGIESQIQAIPNAVTEAMNYSAAIREYLDGVSDEADFYFLGAGPSYGAALFYQAKFFEQARRPVYGVELEEFAHEQFFLLRPGKDAQVWLVAPQGHSQGRAMELAASCREMGARIIAVTTCGEPLQEKADLAFLIRAVPEMFSPLVSVVPGEILGIHAFARWGTEPFFASDRGRQLAVGKRLTRASEGNL
jgi:glucosamine--fructose-6-phosphate aminotransferase (isomerizing)